MDLTSAHLHGLNLWNCVLHQASFSGARFTGGANFGSARFTGGANFGSATFTRGTNFGSARFTKDAVLSTARVHAEAAPKSDWPRGWMTRPPTTDEDPEWHYLTQEHES